MKIRSAFFTIKNLFMGAWRGVRRAVVKLKTSSCRAAKSVVAAVLAFVMVASLFTTLNIAFPTVASAAESQTSSANIAEFQKSEFTKIQNAIFSKNNTSVQTPSTINDLAGSVQTGNDYFNWTDTSSLSLTAWTGSASSSVSSSDTKTIAGRSYTVYNVSTPNDFRYVMNLAAASDNSGNQGPGGWGGGGSTTTEAKYIMLNLTADLDMNGESCAWDPIEAADNGSCFYLEGNGHTIYNLRIYGSSNDVGLFSDAPRYFVVKNLGFQSYMVLNAGSYQAGLLCGEIGDKVYTYNVHAVGGYYQTGDKNKYGIGGLVGRKQAYYSSTSSGYDYGDSFIKNCSVEDGIMYGCDHIGGLTSYIGAENANDCSLRYSECTVPENAMQYATTSGEGEYPWVIENSYSTDCTIFSTGWDSGAFISCGDNIVTHNCYTNNTIYAQKNTAGFIGRINCTLGGKINDDNNDDKICGYFDNCYSTGVVEGTVAMGGFVGLDMGTRSQETIEVKSNNNASSCAIYENCYSTAMVGMDYAGKYCGGFIGFDTNNLSTSTVTINGESKTGAGSWYINCYSAGEVGNILTVTDKADAVTAEASYFSNKLNNTETNVSTILEYYPTGGFAGAIGIDSYTTTGSSTSSSGGFGNFYNCYYDVQTSAMHEMAVGLANLKVSSSSDGVSETNNTSTTVGDDGYDEDNLFDIPGVTGIYTEESTTKGIAGLTDMPSTPGGDGTTTYAMDSNNSSSTTWSYCDQYYPQLSANMVSDTKQNDLNVITDDDLYVTDSDIAVWKESVFYIPDSAVTYEYDVGAVVRTTKEWGNILDSTDTDLSTWSKPVTSLAAVQDATSEKERTVSASTSFKDITAATQMCEVIKAYRYSQASTSTVLLNHWDVLMDTSSGYVSNESSGYGLGLSVNQLTDLGETMEINGVEQTVWSKTYEQLSADSYTFKVQQGDSWAYNYGKDGYNGSEDCEVTVSEDDSNVTIYFAYEYGNLRSDYYYIEAVITKPDGTTETQVLHALPTTTAYTPNTYVVAGGFPTSWVADASTNGAYIMNYDSNVSTDAKHVYTYTFESGDLSADDTGTTYEFKITNGSGWSTNWGLGGVADAGNMKFTINAQTDVTISFVEETKQCTVTAGNEDALISVVVESVSANFRGFAVVTGSTSLLGYKWYENESGVEDIDGACEAGEMTDKDGDGIYTKEVTLSPFSYYAGQNYAYKVIKDGNDDGANHQFYIEDDGSVSGNVTSVTIIFKYNEATGTTSVELADGTTGVYLQPYANYTKYGVAGATELTGYNWTADDSNKMSYDSAYEYYYLTLDSDLFGKTDEDGKLPAGDYSFKVIADNSWSTGIDFGNPNSSDGNYHLVTTEAVSSVTIYFDPQREGDVKIWCSTYGPENAIKTDSYVVTASHPLSEYMGNDKNSSWVFDSPTMSYDSAKDEYYLIVRDVPVNDEGISSSDFASITEEMNFSYSFKVILKNNDQGYNKTFALHGAAGTTYDLIFRYKPSTQALSEATVEVYEHNSNDTVTLSDYNVNNNLANETYGSGESAVKIYEANPTVNFYSVLGDSALTGWNWGSTGDGEEGRLGAAQAGLMQDNDGDGIWELVTPFEVSEIPDYSDGAQTLNLTFKIAGNGTWDSGVNYGADGLVNGENYQIALGRPTTDSPTTCYVNITFNANSACADKDRITVTATAYEDGSGESYIQIPDESSFEWYLAVSANLVANNFTNSAKSTVYDTVRDITSEFSFTYGLGSEERGLTVEKSVERNTAEGFHDTNYFTEQYTLTDSARVSTVTGEFYTDVIDLSCEAVTDESYKGVQSSPLLAHYYVEHFSPGKQWIKINTIGYGYSKEYIKWKENYLNYIKYCTALEKYEEKFEACLKICSSLSYKGDLITESNLIEYLEFAKEENEAIYEGITDQLKENNEEYDILAAYDELENMRTNGYNNDPGSDPNKVTTQAQTIVGARELRLIPASYLEAGSDASVNVMTTTDSGKTTTTNAVTYSGTKSSGALTQNTNYFSVESNQVGEDTNTYDLEAMSIGYYNFAATAAYLTTDRIGLGVYNNYNNARIVKYNSNSIRDDSTFSNRNSDDDETSGDNGAYDGTTASGSASDSSGSERYFAMSSVFTESENYTDNENKTLINTDNTTTNLSVGEFKQQGIIGLSYSSSSQSGAQTIVKVFHVDVDSDGNKKTGTPVYFVNNADSSATYAKNYRKWTGQEAFTADDSGVYEVRFYWTMSDGRYLQDSKYVTVSVIEPGIIKEVSTEYDTSGENKEITYTITYTNDRTDLMLDYAILDVLPFGGDQRDNTKTNKSYSSSGTNLTFKLKNIQVSQSGKSMTKEIYWTNENSVRRWITTTNSNGDTISNEDAANNLEMSTDETDYGYLTNTNTWTALNGTKNELGGYDSNTINFADCASTGSTTPEATAIAITGINLAQGQSVEVKFTVIVNANVSDEYDNNAFFFIRSTLDPTNTSKQSTGMSNPVKTAIVSRDLSGFAWYDKDGDGRLDDGERRIDGLKATLYQLVNGVYQSTGQSVTTGTEEGYSHGYYIFKNINAGTYKVVFSAPDDGNITIVDADGGNSKTAEFSDLSITTTYNEQGEKKDETTLKSGVTTHNLTKVDDAITVDGVSAFATKEVTMPSNVRVYQTNAERVDNNVTFNQYLYTKNYQNAAFTTNNEFIYSLSVTKVANEESTDDDGNATTTEKPLEGVKFMLEYFVPNGDDETASPNADGVTGTWYPVYFTSSGEDTVMATDKKTTDYLSESDYIFSTDSDGLVDFTGLKEAYYRLTEVSTLDGYLKLESPIIIQLPYQLAVDDTAASNSDYTITLEDDNLLKTENNVNYYKHVSMKLINQANQFTIPSSGANNDWLVMSIVGLVILTAAFALFAISKKKRGDKKPS